jgi:hypothetical protein
MEQVPEQFVCPITLDIMKEPVICEDGNTYEKEAIMALKKPISPLTSQPINLKNLIPNRVLKELIQQYLIDMDKKSLSGNDTNNSNKNNKTDNYDDYNMYNVLYDDDFYDEETHRLIDNFIFEDNTYKSNTNGNINHTNHTNHTTQTKSKSTDHVVKDIEIILKNLKINTNSTQIKNFIQTYLNNQIDIYSKPMMNHDIEKIETLYNQSNPIHKSFYLFVIINKLTGVINWLKEKDCLIPNETVNLAVMLGDKDLVLWLINNGCMWDIYTFSYSLENKSIEFMEWLKNKGCFWGCLSSTHEHIIISNSNIKDWLKKNNCTWALK